MKGDNDFKDDDGRQIPGSIFEAQDNRFESFDQEERNALMTALEGDDIIDYDVRKKLLEELYEVDE